LATYCVTDCPRCGMLHITYLYARRTTCPFCGHTYLLRPKRSLSRIKFHGTPVECREFMRKLKVRP